ncbi:MAG: hypothetical protein ACFE9X_12640 [Promethearchaeota archaeon]
MEALKNTEEDYEKVNLTVDQSKIIQEMSRFLCKFIKIPEIAMKGIAWNALREWQIRNNKAIPEIADLPLGKKLNVIKVIFCIGKKMLKTMLKQPKSRNEIIIDIAFEKAFKLFLNYSCKNNC